MYVTNDNEFYFILIYYLLENMCQYTKLTHIHFCVSVHFCKQHSEQDAGIVKLRLDNCDRFAMGSFPYFYLPFEHFSVSDAFRDAKRPNGSSVKSLGI